jgi:hypothetical protein
MGREEGGAKMLRRFVLIASISGGLVGFVLVGPAVAHPGRGHVDVVYTGHGSALWGVGSLSTPSTRLPLVDSKGATAELGSLVLDFSGTKKVRAGTGLWVPPNSSLGELAVFTSGSVEKGTVTADGTVDGSRLKVTLHMAGLSPTSVNSTSTTIGTGTISASIR